MAAEFDYVVVGAGSAGCVVAARLSEAGHRVCLIEAGGRDWHPLIHIPAGVGQLLYHRGYNWMYESEPEAESGNRQIHTPRGRVLGGSSSINGMLYVRGNPADYDGWAQSGCTGWSYDDVLPLFKRSETFVSGGDKGFRGETGPLKVENYRTILPLTHLFVRAAQEAGHPFSDDLNGASAEGVGYSQMTRIGRFRGSTYRAFLTASPGRRNVSIVSDALVTAVILNGRRCTGIRYRRGDDNVEVAARREVIICAGTINSPQLLQLSGIGDPAHLRQCGVTPLISLPGVGKNLSDHYTIRLVARLRDITSLNELSRPPSLLKEIAKFALLGNGALTFGVTSAMVFTRSRVGLASPDIQLLFTPASYVFGKALIFEREPGMTIAVSVTRPSSRGSVKIDRPDPAAAPKIRFGYLTSQDDLRVFAAGLDQARRIFSAPAFSDHLVSETRPGPHVTSPSDIETFARKEGSSLFHPVGTCQMGITDAAVVQPNLKVRGIEGLRIADASVMPFITTGNTNAPTIMIGEKASDLVLADAR